MRWFAIVVAALTFTCAAKAAGEHAGRRAPGFALPDINMNYHDLYDYRGKVVLIEFMKTDCPVCNTFPVILDQIRTKFGNNIQILTVVIPPDNTNTVGQFIARHNLKTPILFDMGQMTTSYVKATPQRPQIVLPQIFLIDAQGVIRHNWVYEGGTEPVFQKNTALIAAIDTLIKAGTPAPPKGAKGNADKAPPRKPVQ
jgi:peroxiredoxin